MEGDPEKKDIGDVNLDYERECHWRIVFEDNDGGVYDKKALQHDKKWDVYKN